MAKKKKSWWKEVAKEKKSRWKSLFESKSTSNSTSRPPLPPATVEQPPQPEFLGSVHERHLRELSEDVAEGLREDDVGNKMFWKSLRGLWDDGSERLATEWATKFLGITSLSDKTERALRVSLADWYDRRGEIENAIEQQEKLSAFDDLATTSHFQLGQYYQRLGNEARALRHYETVLSRDIKFPNAQSRVEALRGSRGTTALNASGQTLTGTELYSDSTSRYRLLRELGRGGSAAVFLAEDNQLRKKVAVKLLHPHLAAKNAKRATEKFFREARVTASLRHPNILAILDIEERSRRIVMELAQGGSLKRRIEQTGALEFPLALEVHLQLLSALEVAHRNGIVHRDIKPGNILFRSATDSLGIEMVLADFGTAHLLDQTDGAPSEEAQAGTIAYMAPEQRTNAAVSPRWDVYSSAVVLYETLHGTLPWDKRTILTGARDPSDLEIKASVLRSLPPDVADKLEAHIKGMTSIDSSDRYTATQANASGRRIVDLFEASS